MSLKPALQFAVTGLLLGSLAELEGQSRDTRWGDSSVAIEFSPRHTGDWDPNRGSGYCNIRLNVDDEVYVYVRGDRVRAERTRGALPQDQGSECSAPLAARELRNFNYRGVDGRGEQRLIEQPNSGNRYTAVAYIRDSSGGPEGYTFRIEWEGRSGDSGSGSSGGSGGGWGGGSGGSWGGGGSYNPGMTGRFNGRGDWQASGVASQSINSLNINLNRNGNFRIDSYGSRSTTMTGRWRTSGNDIELQPEQFYGQSVQNSSGRLVAQNGRMWRLQANGESTSGQHQRFNLNFTADASGSGSGWGGGGGSGWGGGGGSGWGGSNQFNAESNGRGGAFLSGDPDRRLTWARVEATSDNQVTLQVRGEENISMSGRITRRDGDNISLQIQQINGRAASGSGTIQMNGQSLRRIATSGMINGRSYRLNFDAQ